jgi:hypothetical protein
MLPGRKAIVKLYNAAVNPFVSLAESKDNFQTVPEKKGLITASVIIKISLQKTAKKCTFRWFINIT